jgi:uncharacterized protein
MNRKITKWHITLLVVLIVHLCLPRQLTAQSGISSGAAYFTIESYYRVKWGYADEFIRLWKSNHFPLLKKAQGNGDIISIKAEKPRFHSGEDTRWDFRVTVVFKNVASAFDENLLAPYKKGLFPDAESLARSEQHRFELLLAHWDIETEEEGTEISLSGQTPPAYQKEIDHWHAERIQNLKASEGWLNLAGLYWLEEGQNSFGSGGQNKIIFPAGTIAETAGIFERSGKTVRLIVHANSLIKVNEQPVSEAVIFDKDSVRQPVVSSGSLRWTVIQRGEKIGIRLRNLESPLARNFSDIDRYPVDTAWKITATLQAAGPSRTIAISNVLGQTSQQQTPGKLVFSIHNKQYTLDALEEGNELFIIFADETSGKTTYPSGRFLSVKKPGEDGKTTIDFNKAYNPPCAFTDYATCPLPPRENDLPVAVTAGEKNYEHH